MKRLAIFAGILIAGVLGVAQQQPPYPQYPQCAENCTVTTASQFNCSSGNITCSCSSQFLAVLYPCIETECSVLESLAAKNVTANARCHLSDPDDGKILLIIAPICGAIATLILGMRIATSFLRRCRLTAEDYLIIVSWLVVVSHVTIAVEMYKTGVGRNIWNIPLEDTYFNMKLFFVVDLGYLTAISLTKISILLFYLRLFPHIIVTLYAFIVVIACYNVSFVVALLLSHIPLSGAWTAWDGQFIGRQINVDLMWYVAASLNIALDLGIILLPLWQLRHLRMSFSKKLRASLMFLGGIFVIIASTVRMPNLRNASTATNLMRVDSVIALGWWSTIEITASILVASMPSMRLFVLYFFPRAESEADSGGGFSGSPNRDIHWRRPSANNDMAKCKRRGLNILVTDYALESSSTQDLVDMVTSSQPKGFH
ncbi:hypothetical protein BGW36DRAFT_360651 [Talaromyces proteolyticus]|uniref:Extracellular membrane protein CFEM domain-containing protein n=1 Tax=Talaromyces proteolyticus TaxID=1131652 RepID=A0AAD4PWC2_9EURO|nr:uncharacterized protein BGW36DRAFT_360651 [Talaromyces proteolyticus]KAH8694930.1 hypothetical protein BGW36DRAFT_360651 [Talaromyces proteolyticus]